MRTTKRGNDAEIVKPARGAGFVWTAGVALVLYWGTAIFGGGPLGLAGTPVEAAAESVLGSFRASWYGPQFQGRATASGERFDMNGLTAAHRTLPLGTQVRVRNLENGRSVVVRINDRGPYVKGRAIDLSYAAARELRMVEDGEAPVEITEINRLGTAPTAP
jgi:rare lipoprotein A